MGRRPLEVEERDGQLLRRRVWDADRREPEGDGERELLCAWRGPIREGEREPLRAWRGKIREGEREPMRARRKPALELLREWCGSVRELLRARGE